MTIEELIRKNLLLLYVAGISFVIILLSGAYISSSSSDAASEIFLKNKQYRKVTMLYNKLKKCRKTEDLFKNNLLSFVQILKKEGHLNGKILSVTPLLNENRETIDIKLRKLNLKQFLNLIKKISSYSNVNIKQFALTKNFANNNLMNLNLIMQKTK